MTEDHETEYDRLVEGLEAAGYAERYVMEDGRDAVRLTAKGAQVANQLAMMSDDEQGALMAGLLEDSAG